jgi:L-seryl-tRNA(Ser) seleniumtransferase
MHGRAAVLQAARETLEEARLALLRGGPTPVDMDWIVAQVEVRLQAERPALRPVLNVTGILIHTGLGRSPLAQEAVEAVVEIARGYCNLELDLETGRRGRRTACVSGLLKKLTGAEAATVVNNNAAATVLALRALALGREVVVSRGQLVEIGGSFRMPEIFEASGARLREVGTTNKTRLADFERAIGPDTAALLRVHASNFKIVGFTEQPPLNDLAELAHRHGLLLIDDVGSGALAPGLPPGIAGEPTVAEGLAVGADLVLCSGDKLLGGPQCGLMLGSAAAIERVARDPLMRAFRVDKMTLAALEATLRLALDPALASRRVPLWDFITTPVGALRARSERFAALCRDELGLAASVEDSTAYLGGGSLPDEALSSVAVRLRPPFPGGLASEGELARRLRLGTPPVVARVQAGSVLFDLRTVAEHEEGPLMGALRAAVGS